MKTYLKFHDRHGKEVKTIGTEAPLPMVKWMTDADSGVTYQVSGENVTVCLTKGTVESIEVSLYPLGIGPDPTFPRHDVHDHFEWDEMKGWLPKGWWPEDGTELPNGDVYDRSMGQAKE